VVTTSRSGEGATFKLDLSQPDDVQNLIREVQPDLIVNAAAYTSVDKAESEPELAMLVNGTVPGIIAEEAKRCGAGIVHYSTDYVFDGTKGKPYVETDVPNPLNVYGQTKLAGEQAIQAVDVPQLILRTSWVYGMRGKNFLLTMLRLAREREEIKVVADQVGSPTWCGTIADVTVEILAIADWRERSGLYHLTSTNETSWYGFAQEIFALTAGSEGRKLREVLPISSSDYPSPTVRPNYSLLSVDAVSEAFGVGVGLTSWQEALKTALS
jgi:dTDP-4-dehydrorhamnose reductase